jgi:predicted nucleic acid-binding protein
VGLLIDTSVLIEAERGRLDLDAVLRAHGSEEVALSAVSAAELLHGVHRLNGAARARAAAFVEPLLQLLAVLAFDLESARVHAALGADLRRRGVAVGAHDLLIAATAIAADLRIATRDLRSFPRIDGLEVVRW